MPDYRRAFPPGGTFFFTLVTHQRRPLFGEPSNIERLRAAITTVMNERPFEFLAGVVLPDHAHFLWTLPPGDADFSTRIGRMKVLFTKSLPSRGGRCPPYTGGMGDPVGGAPPTPTAGRSASRLKHRAADVWQRRFWGHLIADEAGLNRHLDYIHYNPVKHGLARCPHAWPASSFPKWVAERWYDADWCCTCGGATQHPPDFHWATAGME